jgi:hypothetical protein
VSTTRSAPWWSYQVSSRDYVDMSMLVIACHLSGFRPGTLEGIIADIIWREPILAYGLFA